jgi:serine/threonine protein kinase
LDFSWKEKFKLPIAWMSPELIHFHRYTTASDVFSFGVSMWECFTYGQIPWQGLTDDEVRKS